MSGSICTCGGRFIDAEDYRDHLPCEGSEAYQLRATLAAVTAERDALRVTHKELHRRAQAAEGADARTARIEASSKRLLDRVRRNYVRIIRFRKRLYRDAVAQLLAAGVPDHVDGKPYPEWRTGYLDVLIGRLVAERDDLRAKAADAKQVAITAQAERDDALALLACAAEFQIGRWVVFLQGEWKAAKPLLDGSRLLKTFKTRDEAIAFARKL